MSDTGQAGGAVTLLVARQVEQGYEESFEQWARGILGAAAEHPGNLRTGLLRPTGPEDPWHLVMHFQDAEAFRGWQESPARAACLEIVDGHHVEIDRHELRGMDAWFTSPPAGSRRVAPPPRWKLAIASTLAIGPLTITANLTLTPHLLGLPVVVRSLILGTTLSTLMTYLALPVVNRLLRRWLFPRKGAHA